MLDADDYFSTLRRKLGMEREDELVAIQKLLDAWYPGSVRAKSLNNGLLRLTSPSATIAGELRMRQVELLETLGNVRVEKIVISIGTLI